MGVAGCGCFSLEPEGWFVFDGPAGASSLDNFDGEGSAFSEMDFAFIDDVSAFSGEGFGFNGEGSALI